MPAPRWTPQRLDPLGGVTAQAFAWAFGLGALGTAVVVSATGWAGYQAGWLIAALLALVAAVGVTLRSSAPRLAPFSIGSVIALHLLGLAAVVLEAIARTDTSSGPGWSPAALALLVMVTASFRPATEILVASAASGVVVAVILSLTAADPVASRIESAAVGAVPVLSAGAGAAAFSLVLVRRLLAWRDETARSRRAETLRMRAEAREDLRLHRLGVVEHDIQPFLLGVLRSGGVDAVMTEEARRLAGELRVLLAEHRDEVWLSDLVRTFVDPDRLAARMDETQRAAVEALCTALADRAPQATLQRRGARATLALSWGSGRGALGPELLAMTRHVFPGARITPAAGRIEVDFAAEG
ncbi:MAG: hypothetical protein BGO95_10780 [Micrococcales bacterium 73-13]|nr:MAG: hypothetical protein BGO95_10780 [Micrococcales bacterium 73-13]